MRQPNKGWELYARCRQLGLDPDMFFPERGVGRKRKSDKEFYAAIADAKEVCSMCPVRVQCLAKAKDSGATDGVWGGKFFAQHERRGKSLVVIE